MASGGLAVVGVAALRVAPRRRRFLAAIPFAFAIQQAAEGFQWLTLKAGMPSVLAGYAYAAFAFVFWPVFIPMAVYAVDRRGRRIVRWFLALGIGVALWNLSAMLRGPLDISVVGEHFLYGLYIPHDRLVAVLYVIAVCGALLSSRVRAFRWFGALLFVAAVVVYLWFRPGFPSVWCYFAALISALVFWYLRDAHKRTR